MKQRISLNDLVNLVKSVCPNVTVKEEDDGNIVLVTNTRQITNLHGLIDIDTGKFIKRSVY